MILLAIPESDERQARIESEYLLMQGPSEDCLDWLADKCSNEKNRKF